jgi:hypothetical protein
MNQNKRQQKEYVSLKECSQRSYGLHGLKKRLREGASTLLRKMLSTVLSIGGDKPGYEQVEDGDKMSIEWAEQGLNLCCCDCALVHYIDFEVVDNVIVMTFWRNEEETEEARKRKRVTVEEIDAGNGG